MGAFPCSRGPLPAAHGPPRGWDLPGRGASWRAWDLLNGPGIFWLGSFLAGAYHGRMARQDRPPGERAKYGSEHQRVKRALIAAMTDATPCARDCGVPLAQPGPRAAGREDPPELDHLADGRRALSHKWCNRRAGGQAGLQAAAAAAQREDAPEVAGTWRCHHDAGPRRLAGADEHACPDCGGALTGRCDDCAQAGQDCRPSTHAA
jgi:hypothetical protein